jgi:hypothetical protein
MDDRAIWCITVLNLVDGNFYTGKLVKGTTGMYAGI